MTAETAPLADAQIAAALTAFDARLKVVQETLDDDYHPEGDVDMGQAMANLHLAVASAYKLYMDDGDPTSLQWISPLTGESVQNSADGIPYGFASEMAAVVFSSWGILRRLGFDVGPMLLAMMTSMESFAKRTFVSEPLEEDSAATEGTSEALNEVIGATPTAE